MKLPTERIELPDGQWWEIYAEVTRGMRKQFRRAMFRAVTPALSNGADLASMDAEKLVSAAAHSLDKMDLEAENDAYLTYGTHASSLFSKISTKVLDDLPERYVEPVLTRMRELYAEPTQEERKNLTGT